MTALPPVAARKIDAIFADWNRPDRPGAVVAVLKKGTPIYRRSFGMASVELGVPNGPETVFRVASVTKHFTCLMAVMLARQGKLKLEDPIRKYLPELPKEWPRITVSQMMRNASGIRDHYSLIFLGGGTLEQGWTEAQLYAAILRQKGVNFRPDERFLYCNTNFVLLTRIVEKVAGKPLERILEESLFRPLGMTKTRLVRDRDAVIVGLAANHLRRADGSIVKATLGTAVSGEGGLVSSLDDLCRWSRAFDGADSGLVGAIRELYSLRPFANGTPSHYGYGLALERYRGLMTVGHGGLYPGYRTEFMRIPQRGLAVIVIANVDAIDPYASARQIADILLDGDKGVEPPVQAKPKSSWAGRWIDAASGTVVDLKIEKGVLFGDMWGGFVRFRPLPGGRWKVVRGVFDLTLRFRDGEVQADLGAGQVVRLKRLPPPKVAPLAYVGRWRSEELDADYVVAKGPKGLTVSVEGPAGGSGPWPLEPVAKDLFLMRIASPPWIFSATARFLKRGAKATGLTISAARARNFLFRRT